MPETLGEQRLVLEEAWQLLQCCIVRLSEPDAEADLRADVATIQRLLERFLNMPSSAPERPTPDGSFDGWRETAEAAFARWLREHDAPLNISGDAVTVALLPPLDRDIATPEPRLYLKERAYGPLLLLRRSGEDDGIVLPNPDVHWESTLMWLFPDIDQDWATDLTTARPPASRRVQRTASGSWEVV